MFFLLPCLVVLLPTITALFTDVLDCPKEESKKIACYINIARTQGPKACNKCLTYECMADCRRALAYIKEYTSISPTTPQTDILRGKTELPGTTSIKLMKTGLRGNTSTASSVEMISTSTIRIQTLNASTHKENRVKKSLPKTSLQQGPRTTIPLIYTTNRTPKDLLSTKSAGHPSITRTESSVASTSGNSSVSQWDTSIVQIYKSITSTEPTLQEHSTKLSTSKEGTTIFAGSILTSVTNNLIGTTGSSDDVLSGTTYSSSPPIIANESKSSTSSNNFNEIARHYSTTINKGSSQASAVNNSRQTTIVDNFISTNASNKQSINTTLSTSTPFTNQEGKNRTITNRTSIWSRPYTRFEEITTSSKSKLSNITTNLNSPITTSALSQSTNVNKVSSYLTSSSSSEFFTTNNDSINSTSNEQISIVTDSTLNASRIHTTKFSTISDNLKQTAVLNNSRSTRIVKPNMEVTTTYFNTLSTIKITLPNSSEVVTASTSFNSKEEKPTSPGSQRLESVTDKTKEDITTTTPSFSTININSAILKSTENPSSTRVEDVPTTDLNDESFADTSFIHRCLHGSTFPDGSSQRIYLCGHNGNWTGYTGEICTRMYYFLYLIENESLVNILQLPYVNRFILICPTVVALIHGIPSFKGLKHLAL
uniref:Sushi domain-containing protein n=1 Tax=Heterorhabditis bacteriophora TaxID=37862 RepID=A0A1I7XBG0_HETBA